MRRIVVIFLSNPKFLSTPLFLFFIRNFSLQKKTKMAAKKSPAKKSTKKPVAKKTKAPAKKSAPKVRTTESDNVASGRFSSRSCCWWKVLAKFRTFSPLRFS